MTQDELGRIAKLLEAGAVGDIWYDAAEYREEETAAFIQQVQEAMLAAAQVLRSLERQVNECGN